MTVIATALQHMLAAGMPHDAIVQAVAAMEAATSPATPERSARQERNARYYEARKARLKASENGLDASEATETSEAAEQRSPKTKISPRPPIKTQPPKGGIITTHTHEERNDLVAEIVVIEPPPKPPDKARGSRLSENWTPTAADDDYAAQQGLSPQEVLRVAETFRDYWLAKPGASGRKADWAATWRNWVRRDCDRRQGGRMAPRSAFGGGGGQGPEDFASIVARRNGFG